MRRRSVYAIALAAFAMAAVGSIAATDNVAEIISRLTWQLDDENFGGWSAIEVTADGKSFVAVSDRGHITHGNLKRQGGVLHAVEAAPLRALRNTDGGPMPRYSDDSEGVAIGDDGTIFISFEGVHRVWRYDAVGGEAADLPRHPDFEKMQNNSSLEALAIGADGTLYTMPERSGKLRRPFPVYRFRNGAWDQPFSIPRRGPYLPVGADIGPDGLFYLLERNFAGLRGLFGFSTRIRRFTLTQDDLTGEETLYESGLAAQGNLEGISVWRDRDGAIRMTAIADDNFRALQRTEIVEFRIPK